MKRLPRHADELHASRAAMKRRKIEKVGLAAFDDDRLLVVRKQGSATFILPGGKPEAGETQLQTLAREIDEELGCTVEGARYLRSFIDETADGSATVTVHLYFGDLRGKPHPSAEIVELRWLELSREPSLELAPSIVNQILPYIRWSRPDGAGGVICATG